MGQPRYPHFDALGSTRQLTDASEAITDTWVYDAWGNVLAHAGMTIFPLQFVGMVGYYFDPDTNTFYIIHRIYEPESGRWWSVDLLWLPNNDNQYIYSRGNPSNQIDPSGLSCRRTSLGIDYRPGVGTFILSHFGPFLPNKEEKRDAVGSTLFMKWRWNPERNPFVDEKGCCCCEQVGFIQVATYARQYQGRDLERRKWFLDGGIPYKHSDSINPCAPGAANAINFQDSPNALVRERLLSGIIPTGRRLLLIRHDFETCVVCLKGIHGPRERIESRSSFFGLNEWAEVHYSGMTVYGCVKWMSRVQWSTNRGVAAYRYHRQFMGVNERRIGKPTIESTFPNVQTDGVAPREHPWWGVVKQKTLLFTPNI